MPDPAKRVGRYEVLRRIGRGGMAIVYLARQTDLDRFVALKELRVLDDEDPTYAQRFLRESRVAGSLSHPNIVTVHDYFEHDGTPYIAMEYVEQGSLRPFVGRMTFAQISGVLEGLLAGLTQAEQVGVVHRDLKPENVMVTADGRVKIADFGIAKATTTMHTGAFVTATGTTVGTPAYMAPEQAMAQEIGPWTDLYSVGCMAFEMFTGRVPFHDTDTPMAILMRHVNEEIPSLTEVVPDADPRVSEWIDGLLAKDARARTGSAAEAWDTFDEIVDGRLGPRWRRQARLVDRPDNAAPPKPLTPAPFESTGGPPTPPDEFESLAWGPGPATPPDAPAAERPPPEAPAADPPPPPPPPEHGAGPEPAPARRRLGVLLAAVVALAAIAVIAVLVLGSSAEDPPSTPPEPGLAYDFDDDGRQEIVVGVPDGGPADEESASGAVIVQPPEDAAPTVITQAIAEVPGSPEDEDGFGAGLASADFDRDGHADLAIGTPGKEHVTVLYGGPEDPSEARKQQLDGDTMRLPSGSGDYGRVMIARDVDRDGFGDLVVGAPGDPDTDEGPGAVQILFGSSRGLDVAGATRLRTPDSAFAGFGARLRLGDVNGDDNVDLVEGAPDVQGVAGHASYCPGTPKGPTRCEPLGGREGTGALSIADVNGDGFEDIVEGDGNGNGTAGEIRLVPGSRDGPGEPLTITQESPEVKGNDQPGDQFGGSVETSDLDDDGYADMIVAARQENDGAGRVTIIRGGPDGYSRNGGRNISEDEPGIPGVAARGHQFGSTMAFLELESGRRDLAVAVPGAGLDQAVVVIELADRAFEKRVLRASQTSQLGDGVVNPDDDPIRLARNADG